MFGEDPKVGLTSSSLPPEILKAAILSKKYSSNKFDLCPQQLLNDSDVNTESTITLRQALKFTASGGQGSSGVTAAKARNSVRQTGASVIKQRDFVTAGVTGVSVVIIRIENCVQILKLIIAFSDCYFIIVIIYE